MYIDCRENPYDLRPSADAIIRTLYAKLEEVERNAVVVIVFGEIHSMPSHVILKQLILSRLCALREKDPQEEISNFFVAYEDEFDRLEKNLIKYCGKLIPPEVYGKMYKNDEQSKALLSSILGFGQKEYSYAPVSKMNLFAFCYHNDITVHCVDVALNEIYLSETDTLATNVYSRYYGGDPNQFRISAGSVTGIAIRNKVMALRTIERARELKARVILLCCGRVHVFGQKAINGLAEFPYEDSLINQFNEMGISTIPVFITQKSDYS